MQRAVLIVNPFSTAVTESRVAAVEAVLRRSVELETHHTEARGHATAIAAEASRTADAVIVFSGDGTYNEAINGAGGQIAFGFLPGFHVTNGTVMVGAGIALLLSAVSGFTPAYQAARMPVVNALRRVE